MKFCAFQKFTKISNIRHSYKYHFNFSLTKLMHLLNRQVLVKMHKQCSQHVANLKWASKHR